MMAIYPMAVFNTNPKVLPPGTKKVILLVHGFLHNRTAWYYIEPRLKSQPDLGPVFTLNLGHPFQSIEKYTQKLRTNIAEVQKMADHSDIEFYLIGHSMGGLVSINYAANYAQADHITIPKVVTIASPIQGTPFANVSKLLCPCGYEMLPNSDFLWRLQKNVESLKSTQFFHIGGGRDLIVSKDHTFFKGGSNHYEPSSLGHISVLNSPEVTDCIIQFLKA